MASSPSNSGIEGANTFSEGEDKARKEEEDC